MKEPETDEPGEHGVLSPGVARQVTDSIYRFGDLIQLQACVAEAYPAVALSSVEELLERDAQRDTDGFPRKIRLGRIVRPGRRDAKVVLVPTVVEEKFVHDHRPPRENEAPSSGGSGEGEDGEVIGEAPAHQEGGSGAGGSGEGADAGHEIEANAYALGRILTERFSLPNLKDKGKKCYLNRYAYDLTDVHPRSGQVLDKKATLRRILRTNIGLDRVPDVTDVDTTTLLVSPDDHVYRILSREREPQSQALVFFLRDYSGSMSGTPTEIVSTQHVLIYSWLTYQYDRQVQTRFVLHDTEAKEVPDFHTYVTLSIAGGTRIESAYRLVNTIVEEGGLARDYNIYVFHGTDGDDWDANGDDTVVQVRRMLSYCSRFGITVARPDAGTADSVVERVFHKSRLLTERPDLIRMHTIRGEADESRLMDGIKALVEP